MTHFASLREVLSPEERENVEKVLAAALSAEEGTEAGKKAAASGHLLLEAYDSLLTRMRLAELVVYRSSCLADDMESIIERGKTARAGGPSPEGLANMARHYVRDYVEPILPALREALGYEEGAAQRGWYLPPEEVRAKLIGSIRAEERLKREGRRLP